MGRHFHPFNLIVLLVNNWVKKIKGEGKKRHDNFRKYMRTVKIQGFELNIINKITEPVANVI